MVEIIVRFTNKKASQVYAEYNRNNPDKTQLQWKPVTTNEIYAFMVSLICAGANNSNTDHTEGNVEHHIPYTVQWL